MEYLIEEKDKIINLINSGEDCNIELAVQLCGYEWLYNNIFKDTYELISKYGYKATDNSFESMVIYCLSLERLDLENNNLTSFDESKYKNVNVYL